MDNEVKEALHVYEKRKYTIAEYLAMEKVATEKHEYFEGEIFPLHRTAGIDLGAVAGAELVHNEIFSNLFTELGIKLKGTKCRPYGSDKTHDHL